MDYYQCVSVCNIIENMFFLSSYHIRQRRKGKEISTQNSLVRKIFYKLFQIIFPQKETIFKYYEKSSLF